MSSGLVRSRPALERQHVACCSGAMLQAGSGQCQASPFMAPWNLTGAIKGAWLAIIEIACGINSLDPEMAKDVYLKASVAEITNRAL